MKQRGDGAMGHPRRRNPGRGVLGAVFAEARNRGVRPETLRNVIAPKILGKRISEANDGELHRLLDHLQKILHAHTPGIDGLRGEVCDLARERFGRNWEPPLNALCRRFGVSHWRWLDVRYGKAVKAALVRLQLTDPRDGEPKRR